MSIARKPIVVVGSINIDLVASAERIPVPGETVTGHDFQVHPDGKGANQAVAVARLDYPVKLIGHLGNDGFGAQLRSHLESAGVDLSGVAVTEGPSGVAVIVVSQAGDNSIVVVAGANAYVTPGDLDDNLEMIRSAGMVLAQLEIPLETIRHLANLCSDHGVPLMLDPAPARALPADLIERVTWFTPNESEAAFFIGDSLPAASHPAPQSIAEALIRNGLSGVVLKMGEQGAYVANREGLRTSVDSFPVEAVDTTAAGDCFNGAFATALCLGSDPVTSARFAAAAAAISVTRVGAQASMPSASEVREMLTRDAPGSTGR